MSRLLLLIIFIHLLSCAHNSKIIIRNFHGLRGAKILRVDNLMLFNGKIKYNVGDKKVRNDSIFLIFSNDTLKFISRKLDYINEDNLFKFQKLNDSMNILTNNWRSTYYHTDTMLFTSNCCIIKDAYYNSDIESKKKLVTGQFRIYCFDKETYTFCSTNINNNESIFNIAKAIYDPNIQIKPIGFYDSGEYIGSYSNRASLMFKFFNEQF